jgi:3-deoxy-D-manno-octulosonate 8-phosphate phosphatase (KDO 8-P phosphatase)
VSAVPPRRPAPRPSSKSRRLRLRPRDVRAEGSPARGPTSARELLRRAAKIRLVLLDVDGVLTDGRLYYGADGEALKAFDVKDGHGVVLLRDQVDFGVISGRPGKASETRLRELRFKHLVFGERDKLEGYAKLAHLGVPDDEVAYMGDDVNDVPLLRKVGLAACPADARPEARAVAHLVASARGGRGAVRELCDLILAAKARTA